MKRLVTLVAVGLAVALLAPALVADVKTQEKTIMKMEGLLGGFVNRAAGGADGKTSTVALKGNRLAEFVADTGTIVDLTEEKIYSIDRKKKEYSVVTFAEMRAAMDKMRKDLEKQQAQMNPGDKEKLREAGQQMDFDFNVKETGQRRNIAGHDASETVLTLALHEKGKTLEESGGFVTTSTIWLGPKIAALDELAEFRMRQFKAIYGQAFDAQQLNAMAAMFPGFGAAKERLAAESQKLKGTPLVTTTVFESVKSAEQMKSASEQASSTGGGIGGMLGRRLAGNRGEAAQRSLVMTTTSETLSIGASVSMDEVGIPPEFKLKK
jgi:hypothetical protein